MNALRASQLPSGALETNAHQYLVQTDERLRDAVARLEARLAPVLTPVPPAPPVVPVPAAVCIYSPPRCAMYELVREMNLVLDRLSAINDRVEV